MSRELAAVLYLALCVASAALRLRDAIGRACVAVCPCGTCGGAR